MTKLHILRGATTAAVALVLSTAYAADNSSTNATSQATTQTAPMTGKQKATAIGAGTGAVAGAVVGGPVGALIGAGIGGYVGHEGTDANGKTSTASNTSDRTVRNAQTALNAQGYDVGRVDGQFGPNTQNAVRRFQTEHNLAPTGSLTNATLEALGVGT